MYKLYYSPGSCSMAVHVLLNELNVPFELDRRAIREGATKTPEFLKINPRGQVPVLQDGDAIIKEGAAILIHLMDTHGSPLLPESGIARAKALEWLGWCNATLHGAYSKVFWIMKTQAGKPYQGELMKEACEQIQSLWEEADERLAKTPWLAGDAVTAADILMSVIANWNQWISYDFRLGNNVRRVIKDVIARPSYQKALQTEQIEYKAAA